MNVATKEILNLMEILPESDQQLAVEIVKKFVLARDPDYTKITPSENLELEKAVEEIHRGDVVSHNDIDWD